jgi:hypothetical protein
MPVTQEPRGLAWINNLNMTTFGPLISQVCWLAGSFAFTWLACYLTTRLDFYEAVGTVDQNGARQMVLISRETVRQLGNTLALALLAAWTGKSVIGSVDAHNKRKVLSEEKKSLGSDLAAAIETAEHKSLTAKMTEGQPTEITAEAGTDKPTNGEDQPENVKPPVEPKWADGRDPDHGAL